MHLAYLKFIEELTDVLDAFGGADRALNEHSDSVDVAMRAVYAAGSESPQAIQNWDHFMELAGSDVSFGEKWNVCQTLLNSHLAQRQ